MVLIMVLNGGVGFLKSFSSPNLHAPSMCQVRGMISSALHTADGKAREIR